VDQREKKSYERSEKRKGQEGFQNVSNQSIVENSTKKTNKNDKNSNVNGDNYEMGKKLKIIPENKKNIVSSSFLSKKTTVPEISFLHTSDSPSIQPTTMPKSSYVMTVTTLGVHKQHKREMDDEEEEKEKKRSKNEENSRKHLDYETYGFY
jgi:hypothetical protein